MAGAVQKKLNELQQNTKNAIITALIITKTDPKYFLVKKSMEFRGVITFTLRDSKSSLCNCKYWGSKEIVEDYNRQMKIGDIIDVISPLVITQKFFKNEHNRFLPLSTLPIALVVNEGEGSLRLNAFQNVKFLNQLQELMFIPHRPIFEALRLCDVLFGYMGAAASSKTTMATTTTTTTTTTDEKSTNMPSQSVDLLVMIAQIRPTKLIHQKEKETKCLEIVVFDQSVPDGMLLSIWHYECIQRAEQFWQPMKTVLHLIDVDAVDSSYHKCCILRKTARTVIYENPFGKEVNALREYAKNMQPQNFHIVGQAHRMLKLPNPDDIQDQMTVKQIYRRLEDNNNENLIEFTAVLYGMITKFNLDELCTIIGRKCKSCQRILMARATNCTSECCQSKSASKSATQSATHSRSQFPPLAHNANNFDFFYNLNIQFGDHTGTLVEARLTEGLGEEIFKMSAANFQLQFKENEENLEMLKWRYLFRRFEVKLLLKKTNLPQRGPIKRVLIIAMQPTDNLDVIANKMIVY